MTITKADLPREKEQYIPTRHLKQMMEERYIGWHEIGKAIEEGDVLDAKGVGTHRFRLDFPVDDLFVVVGDDKDFEELSVVTTYYDGQNVKLTEIPDKFIN